MGNEKWKMLMALLLLIVAALCLQGLAHGQASNGPEPVVNSAQAPVAGDLGQQWQIGAGYASVGGPTSNGQLYTIAKQIDNRLWLAAKGFTLANPAGVVIAVGTLRYRVPLAALRKPNQYLDTAKWLVSADFNIGATKDTAETARFAYGVGAGLDYRASDTVTLMLLQMDYIRSKVLPNGGVFVHNINSFTTGLKFTF